MTRACRIKVQRNGRRATLRLTGPLAMGSGASQLLRRVRTLVTGGATHLILDVSGVPFVDCSGIGLLIRCRDEARGRGADLRVTHCRGPLRRMLSLSALLEPLEGRDGPREDPTSPPGQDAPPLFFV